MSGSPVETTTFGAVVRVVATFKQAGSGPIRLKKKVRLKYNGQRNVHFKRPVTQNETSAYQSAPGYFEGNACSVRATIINTFALPGMEPIIRDALARAFGGDENE